LPVPLRPTIPTLWPVGILAEALSNSGLPSMAYDIFEMVSMMAEQMAVIGSLVKAYRLAKT